MARAWVGNFAASRRESVATQLYKNLRHTTTRPACKHTSRQSCRACNRWGRQSFRGVLLCAAPLRPQKLRRCLLRYRYASRAEKHRPCLRFAGRRGAPLGGGSSPPPHPYLRGQRLRPFATLRGVLNTLKRGCFSAAGLRGRGLFGLLRFLSGFLSSCSHLCGVYCGCWWGFSVGRCSPPAFGGVLCPFLCGFLVVLVLLLRWRRWSGRLVAGLPGLRGLLRVRSLGGWWFWGFPVRFGRALLLVGGRVCWVWRCGFVGLARRFASLFPVCPRRLFSLAVVLPLLACRCFPSRRLLRRLFVGGGLLLRPPFVSFCCVSFFLVGASLHGGARAFGGCPVALVGFSGSRSLSVSFAPVVARVVGSVVGGGRGVAVGCAAGADAFARDACPSAVVFSVSSGAWGAGRGAFAGRSCALVRAVAGSGIGAGFVCFPAAMCPVGLVPSASASACFSGAGSGSWASAAFAAGLGLPLVVFPCGFAGLPSAWGSWSPLSGAWSGGFRFVPLAVAVPLF